MPWDFLIYLRTHNFPNGIAKLRKKSRNLLLCFSQKLLAYPEAVQPPPHLHNDSGHVFHLYLQCRVWMILPRPFGSCSSSPSSPDSGLASRPGFPLRRTSGRCICTGLRPWKGRGFPWRNWGENIYIKI